MGEIQKSKLNNFLTNWAFPKKISLVILSLRALWKLLICYIVSWNFNFAATHVSSFSCQKPLKLKNKKHTTLCNTKNVPPYKLWAQTDKNCKSSSLMASIKWPKSCDSCSYKWIYYVQIVWQNIKHLKQMTIKWRIKDSTLNCASLQGSARPPCFPYRNSVSKG